MITFFSKQPPFPEGDDPLDIISQPSGQQCESECSWVIHHTTSPWGPFPSSYGTPSLGICFFVVQHIINKKSKMHLANVFITFNQKLTDIFSRAFQRIHIN
ncbi:hypothetical protein TNIN_122011 [Trichonephila inaurata madagascariensis]|uniref:Uncharacterized protein n=1 Tax=Trichonephila inaurata madagascariensis TaxID=2747483 RepID=A0A8X6WPI9_9ARAC|nr:hypothetical protein TNIN_122011 [Trichonephila inaurata madagascariensis]